MNGIPSGIRVLDKSEPLVVVPESIVLAGLVLEGLPLKVWLILKRYASHKGDVWVSFISLKRIAEKVDRSVSQVSRAIAHLEKIVTFPPEISGGKAAFPCFCLSTVLP